MLQNLVGDGNEWLGLRLITADGGRDALGARVELIADPPRWSRARADGSYASANDPRILFGLGSAGGKRDVHVVWPDGSEERFLQLATSRYHTLRQGEGVRVAEGR